MSSDAPDLQAPTPNQMAQLVYQHRFLKVCDLLDWNPVRRRITLALVTEGDGWSQASLAALTHQSRTTTRTYLEKMESENAIERRDDGLYYFTPRGRKRFLWLHAEIDAICRGDQAGLSEELLTELGDLPRDRWKIDQDIATVSFPQKLNVDVSFEGLRVAISATPVD